MAQYEKAGFIDTPARCALFLHDKDAASRLLTKAQQNGNIYGSVIGRLAILIGDMETANNIMQSFMTPFFNKERVDPDDFLSSIFPAVRIAADLPDKTIAKQLIQELEKYNRISLAVEIAVKIDDKETLARIMQQIENKGLSIGGDYTTLSLLALYHPELAMKVVKRHESHDYFLSHVATAAAVLGDREMAKVAMNKLKEAKSYCIACSTAAILGDTSTAEALMWEFKKKEPQLPDANFAARLQIAALHNPEAAYHLLQALENHGNNVGWLAMIILEYLGWVALSRKRSNPNGG
jgi:hypothetical protein